MSILSSGTSNTTALVYTSDTTGNLVFQTNGTTEAMRIANTQYVGIGTSTPQSPLEVNGLIRTSGFVANPSSGAGMEMAWDGTQGIIQAFSNRTALTTAPVYFTGGQIKFPASQNASTDPNTLDDYEEGSWTPAVNILYGITPSSATYTGRYVKIGKLVYASFSFNFNSSQTVATGMRGRMSGLPFTPENPYTIDNFNGGGSASNFYSWSGNQNTQVLIGVSNSAEVFFNINIVNGSTTFVNNPITGYAIYTAST